MLYICLIALIEKIKGNNPYCTARYVHKSFYLYNEHCNNSCCSFIQNSKCVRVNGINADKVIRKEK